LEDDLSINVHLFLLGSSISCHINITYIQYIYYIYICYTAFPQTASQNLLRQGLASAAREPVPFPLVKSPPVAIMPIMIYLVLLLL
jgi:hypothetical protein